MRRVVIAIAGFAAFAALSAAAPVAQAAIVISVDKTAQRLTVDVDGVTRYRWPVSTARWGYRTPNGSYRPQRLERQWYSRKYDWSPMPYSIFFAGGYAIHGSNEISRLGRPASHGCIRLHPANAAVLFDLVRRNTANTRILITGGGEELMARGPAQTREQLRERARPVRSVYRAPRAKVPAMTYRQGRHEARHEARHEVRHDARHAPRHEAYYVKRRPGRSAHDFEALFSER
jgi:hypothetical protein